MFHHFLSTVFDTSVIPRFKDTNTGGGDIPIQPGISKDTVPINAQRGAC